MMVEKSESLEQVKASIGRGIAEATKHLIGRPLGAMAKIELQRACLDTLNGYSHLWGMKKPELDVVVEEDMPGDIKFAWTARNQAAIEVFERLGFDYYDATEKLTQHIPEEIGEGDDAWIWDVNYGPGNHWRPKTEVGGSCGYLHYDEDSGEYTIDGTYTKGQIINLARLLDIDPELKPPTEEQGES